ncbi:MATE efflux family protein [Alkaliphilus metalliredigens QYMF]|uniref:Probable multidrug resistance protein NorM n=1 Tax=Alkaliphilus metalliredigens (strain QYMF) TaxID=293826 RepID=A6TX03_ALKMQ|nr:MATE family efflux transporter [Alkaliphilus metalliredigens]ABR50721.1 MATE efflux family protein [Alkaliphilus metalliredigens QYMF]
MATSLQIPSKIEVRRKILSMILPITMENVLQMSAGFVTMAMIGRISAVAVAAVGISMRITQIIWALFRGVTTGATVFVAQSYGSGNLIKLKKVIQQTLLSSIILVLILQQLLFWFAPQILNFFKGDPTLIESGIMYLRTLSWGLPFVAVIQVVAGVLQGMGNAKTPMKIALIMNVINMILSYTFIFGPLGLPAMGLRGAAVALVVAQSVAALLGIYVLFNRHGILGTVFNRSFFKLDMKQVIQVYRVGSPTAVESIFWQVSSIALTMIILDFGEVSLAAYQLGLQAESISYMPAMGFSVASTAFIGQALGAKDPQLGKRYLKEIVTGSFLITIFSASVLIFFPAFIMRLLTDQQEIIDVGIKYLFFMGLVQIPQNMAGVLNGALRGAGFTRVPMIVAGTGLWLIRIPFSYILVQFFDVGITAIWIVMCFDLVFRFILSFTLYKRKNIYEQEPVIEKMTVKSEG